jgi:hypothetical protein
MATGESPPRHQYCPSPARSGCRDICDICLSLYAKILAIPLRHDPAQVCMEWGGREITLGPLSWDLGVVKSTSTLPKRVLGNPTKLANCRRRWEHECVFLFKPLGIESLHCSVPVLEAGPVTSCTPTGISKMLACPHPKFHP